MTVQLTRLDTRLRKSVLVASPSLWLRQGLRQLPRVDAQLALIGECARAEELFSLLGRLEPDVVLVDTDLEGMADLSLLARLLSSRPETRVVLLLARELPDGYLGKAATAGAAGFVLRDADAALLTKALRAVAAGRPWLQRELTEQLLQDYKRMTSPGPRIPGPMLSPRQRQVLDLLSQGLRSREIAEQLSISEKTVKAHLTSLFRKLGVTNRLGAVCLALGRE